ncbi:MAG: hypothetical protein DMF62_06395 [Acidobacteria bacterium]|nr:MAG: hypothetical protein DMF62_06395 [Acidobacteriota bacterium]
MNLKSITMFASILFVFSGCASPQTQSSTEKLIGDWYGESKCVGRNTSCHDEVVVYHISRIEKEPTKVHLSADKIVDGKPEFMGEFDFVFDEKKDTLTADFKIPRTGGTGVWLFKVNGDKIEGTLTILPENEVGRVVKVSRKKPDVK